MTDKILRRPARLAAAVALSVALALGAHAQPVAPDGPYPPLRGHYVRSDQHPRVFQTPADLKDIAARTASSGSYSAQMFDRLAAQVARDLAAPVAWDATYSGCGIEIYLYAFSYEPQDAATAAKLRATLAVPASAQPPAGAAIVAARLALYAALIQAGARPSTGAPPAAAAGQLAKRILLAWVDRGFRDGAGRFLSSARQFCGQSGAVDAGSMSQVGLQIARGVIYSVQAHDLLIYLAALDGAEGHRAEAFHAAMYSLILDALNYRFLEQKTTDCDHYGNHVANQLAGLLATARLLDDEPRFEAALRGSVASIRVGLPWVAYFNHAIYGQGQRPHRCAVNAGPSGPSSRPFFQTDVVAPGEIDDRFRNDQPNQAIGYSMFTLERLFDAAAVLRIAGYEPYDYRGSHGQSLELAARFFSCYARGAGFGNRITVVNAGTCPDFSQYDGKTVSGVDRMIIAAAFRFPNDEDLTSLDAAAKIAAGRSTLPPETLLFGDWRN